jgi:toxin YoeB
MHKDWHENAWDDYLYWQTQDKKTVRKINSLLKSIERGERLGKMELLKADYSGWSSARIDQENRLVFKVADDVLMIASCRGHYQDS